jgi:predicted nucleic acid-binding Zn ribbon protein
MHKHYKRLNLSPSASNEEVWEAYTKARTRLTAEAQTDDEDIKDELKGRLQALNRAYESIMQSRDVVVDEHLAKDESANEIVQATSNNLSVDLQASREPASQRACPHCNGLNPVKAMRCLHCGQQISRPCPQCGFPVALDAQVCPRCHIVIPEYDQQRFAEATAIEKQKEEKRRISEAHAEALESVHRTNARLGILFWSIVVIISIGLCIGMFLLLGYLSQNGYF